MADKKNARLLVALKDARRTFRMMQIMQEHITKEMSELAVEMSDLTCKFEELDAIAIGKDEVLDVYKEYFDDQIEASTEDSHLGLHDVYTQFKTWISLYFPKTTVYKSTFNSRFKQFMGAPIPLKNNTLGWKGYAYKDHDSGSDIL